MTKKTALNNLAGAVQAAARAFAQKYNDRGEELPDPTPVAVPVKFTRPPSIHEMIRTYIRSEEFNRKANDAGVETFDEANDFEVEGDDPDDVLTAYEVHPMHEEFYARDVEEAAQARKAPGGPERADDPARPDPEPVVGPGEGGGKPPKGRKRPAAEVEDPDDD